MLTLCESDLCMHDCRPCILVRRTGRRLGGDLRGLTNTWPWRPDQIEVDRDSPTLRERVAAVPPRTHATRMEGSVYSHQRMECMGVCAVCCAPRREPVGAAVQGLRQ